MLDGNGEGYRKEGNEPRNMLRVAHEGHCRSSRVATVEHGRHNVKRAERGADTILQGISHGIQEMNKSYPTEDELVAAIESAAEMAIKDLFVRHPGHYYYLSFITTGEAHPPILAAWSEEALEEAVRNEVDSRRRPDKEDARWGLKWSYADSPFCCYGSEHFERVNHLFAMRPGIDSLDASAWEAEYDLRLRAMETALSRLDLKGTFGVGEERLRMVVNVEVMPPDFTNTERAKRLNPPEAIRTWLEEAAEPLPS